MTGQGFDPLLALSEARTALSDPGGVDIEPGDFWRTGRPSAKAADYAVERIDWVMGSLRTDDFNSREEIRTTLTTLGRLLAEVVDTIEAGDVLGGNVGLIVRGDISEALDNIDQAIDLLQ